MRIERLPAGGESAMKTVASSLALVLTLAVTGLAHAVIDGPRFDKEASKYGADIVTGRIRKLCVCQDGGANQYHVGYLVKSAIGVSGGVHLTMTCQIPTLSSFDRSYVSAQNCLTYEVLSR
jgi:hypothetical protein